MRKKRESDAPKVLRTILTVIGIVSGLLSVLFFAFIIFLVASAFVSPTAIISGNIAVIPIKGIILTEEDFGTFASPSLSSLDIVSWIQEAEADPDIQGIIFEVDSPGGTPVATEEVATAIREMEKPNVAVIREIGASGAYWIASASDRIYASRMSVVGSIGVLASYVEIAGTLERYNATYRSLTAGEFKDTSSPFKRLTPTEEAMIQKQLDRIHTIFIRAVAENRGLPEDKVREIANGWVYLGEEALDIGLVDSIGDFDDAVIYLEDRLDIEAEIVEFRRPRTFFESLAGVLSESSYYIGQGFGHAITTPKVEDRLKIYT